MTTTKRFLGAAALAVGLFIYGCGSSGGPCSEDSDCSSGETCLNGTCGKPGGGGGGPCTPGQVCRPSAGDCDVDEVCPASGTCPADTFVATGTVCRAPAGPCDIEERCTGNSAQCPADLLAPQTTVCRSSAGGCDPEEICTGASAQCPPDTLAPASTTCRPAMGICDVAEACNGTSPQCPQDGFEPSGTECRAAGGDCDIAETCSGSGPACPADALEPDTTECRAAVSACDLAETCPGNGVDCPADAFVAGNTPCAAASCTVGTFTPARACEGGTATCQMATSVSCNGYQCDAAGTNCRTSCASSTECLSTHYCQTNQCAPKRADGQACTGPTSGFECIAGACTGSFIDADGDGFGIGTVGHFCGAAPPAGRAAVSGDCCDTDNRAKPGQTSFFTTARTVCGGFDFNCDGSQTLQFVGANACKTTGGCGTGDLDCNGDTGWSAATNPACGATALYVTTCNLALSCNQSTCPGCNTCNASTQNRAQGCR